MAQPPHPYYYGYPPMGMPPMGMPQVMPPAMPPAMPQAMSYGYNWYQPMGSVAPAGSFAMAPDGSAVFPPGLEATATLTAQTDYLAAPGTTTAAPSASVSATPSSQAQESAAAETEETEEEAKARKEKSKRLEVHGNDNMNLNHIIISNIKSSDYFKSLYDYPTYDQVIQLIAENVTYLNPWVPKTQFPSSAFCLLYKLFTLRLTVKQMKAILNHKTAMVRGLGYLYLRLCYPPKKLWEDWFQYAIEDEEEFTPYFNAKPLTIYQYAKKLLTDFRYCDMLFPRIPIPVERELEKVLKESEAAYAVRKAEEEAELEEGPFFF
eukprot:TRINITY_DN407_c0_g1_i13.p1 TRINITY_DN407_c0_g1~~TRINITY_DN407_c0_g1_i13.p1  ORF type:complete len:321 (-),score=65.06 TRINITY_DN407_c0_g1_i13:1124-2086(-)